eukprot:753191-Hanusia_phi.AAC.3
MISARAYRVPPRKFGSFPGPKVSRSRSLGRGRSRRGTGPTVAEAPPGSDVGSSDHDASHGGPVGSSSLLLFKPGHLS